MRRVHWLLVLSGLWWGCDGGWVIGGPPYVVGAGGRAGGADGAGTGAGQAGSGGGGQGSVITSPSALADAGLPCAAAVLLAQACVSCHGRPTSGGAPTPLMSLDDLKAASARDPAQSYGQRSVVRLQDSVAPMPPRSSPAPSADAVTQFAAWVSSGMPQGSCAEVASIDAGLTVPPPIVPTCLSGRYAQKPVAGDAHGGTTMAPGLACLSCHTGQNFAGQNPGNALNCPDEIHDVMGTVFEASYEKDLCRPDAGAVSAATVEILNANNAIVGTFRVNAGGNFYGDVPGGLPMPYTARVVVGTNHRTMATPQTSGDCNTCHTSTGANGAPGRIVLP